MRLQRNSHSVNCSLTKFREELFVNSNVAPMTDLTARLAQSMGILGVTTVKASTKKHVRRKLEAEFEELLQIITDDKGTLLVYPENLSLPELVKSYHVLQTKVQVMESERTHEVFDKAALHMRDDHRRTGPVSFRGAEVSCPNIFSITCPKIKWFCPNIT